MKVLFAPDYRAANPYQRLLAPALAAEGVDVIFPAGYRRILPLARTVAATGPEIIHLHWPEAYFPQRGKFTSRLRLLRWPLDLAWATRHTPLILTAHNLWPHAARRGPLLKRALHQTYRRAARIIVHSTAALEVVARTHGVDTSRFRVIPHGDLLPAETSAPPPAAARASLTLAATRYCLVFGSVEPYKGLEELIAWWTPATANGAELWIVGRAWQPEYEAVLARQQRPGIRVMLERPSDERLATLVAAADAVILNHQASLTSGVASLARSLGAPIVLPARLHTVDLAEPSPLVFRFDDGASFHRQVAAACAAARDPAETARWRRSIAWSAIARATRKIYDELGCHASLS